MTTLKLLILLVALSTISSRITSKDTYPKRTSIKGLQPDGQDTNQIIGNQVHGAAFKFEGLSGNLLKKLLELQEKLNIMDIVLKLINQLLLK